jgi:hypothetical protein
MTTYTQMPMFTVVQTDATTLLRIVPLTELELMDADLDVLQDGDWEAPFARLTAEQLEEIENERPGHELCTNPWEW